MTAELIEAGQPRLRIFRVLDEKRLSEAFVDANQRFEGGTLPYVDADRPRDVELTEEIMEATIGAVLVNTQGEVVAEFDGNDAVSKAERAKSSAKITFSLDLPEEKPKRGSRAAVTAAVEVADEADSDFS